MNEFVGSLEERAETQAAAPARHAAGRLRYLAIESLGPVTILAGVVWAIAQPYRIVFLRDTDKGLWDYLGQPPILVALIGLAFSLFIAPGLLDDLRAVEEEREGDDAAAR